MLVLTKISIVIYIVKQKSETFSIEKYVKINKQ